MPTSDEVVDPGLLVLVQDLGHLDSSSEVDAGAFEPESVGESHRVRGSRISKMRYEDLDTLGGLLTFRLIRIGPT